MTPQPPLPPPLLQPARVNGFLSRVNLSDAQRRLLLPCIVGGNERDRGYSISAIKKSSDIDLVCSGLGRALAGALELPSGEERLLMLKRLAEIASFVAARGGSGGKALLAQGAVVRGLLQSAGLQCAEGPAVQRSSLLALLDLFTRSGLSAAAVDVLWASAPSETKNHFLATIQTTIFTPNDFQVQNLSFELLYRVWSRLSKLKKLRACYDELVQGIPEKAISLLSSVDRNNFLDSVRNILVQFNRDIGASICSFALKSALLVLHREEISLGTANWLDVGPTVMTMEILEVVSPSEEHEGDDEDEEQRLVAITMPLTGANGDTIRQVEFIDRAFSLRFRVPPSVLQKLTSVPAVSSDEGAWHKVRLTVAGGSAEFFGLKNLLQKYLPPGTETPVEAATVDSCGRATSQPYPSIQEEEGREEEMEPETGEDEEVEGSEGEMHDEEYEDGEQEHGHRTDEDVVPAEHSIDEAALPVQEASAGPVVDAPQEDGTSSVVSSKSSWAWRAEEAADARMSSSQALRKDVKDTQKLPGSSMAANASHIASPSSAVSSPAAAEVTVVRGYWEGAADSVDGFQWNAALDDEVERGKRDDDEEEEGDESDEVDEPVEGEDGDVKMNDSEYEDQSVGAGLEDDVGENRTSSTSDQYGDSSLDDEDESLDHLVRRITSCCRSQENKRKRQRIFDVVKEGQQQSAEYLNLVETALEAHWKRGVELCEERASRIFSTLDTVMEELQRFRAEHSKKCSEIQEAAEEVASEIEVCAKRAKNLKNVYKREVDAVSNKVQDQVEAAVERMASYHAETKKKLRQQGKRSLRVSLDAILGALPQN
jgi:hypothetical protein